MNYVGGIITILFLFEPRKIIFACAVNNRARISIFPTSASVQTRGGGLGRDVKAGYLKPTFRHVNHATGLLGISFRWHNSAICTESPERSKWPTTFPLVTQSGDWPQFSGLMAFIFNLSRCFRVRLYGFVFLSHSTRLAIFFFLRLQCQGPTFKSINCQIWIFFIFFFNSSCSPFQFRSWTVKNVFTKC